MTLKPETLHIHHCVDLRLCQDFDGAWVISLSQVGIVMGKFGRL